MFTSEDIKNVTFSKARGGFNPEEVDVFLDKVEADYLLFEKVSKDYQAKIAELDHWTDKQETKATIDNLIRDTLWAELPECYDELSISNYRQRIYEYVYTRYKDVA